MIYETNSAGILQDITFFQIFFATIHLSISLLLGTARNTRFSHLGMVLVLPVQWLTCMDLDKDIIHDQVIFLNRNMLRMFQCGPRPVAQGPYLLHTNWENTGLSLQTVRGFIKSGLPTVDQFCHMLDLLRTRVHQIFSEKSLAFS